MQRFTRRFMAACVLSTVVASGAAIANDHPTIRAMSGAEQITQLPAAKTALIVIDFQNEYFTGRMPIPDGASALAKALELIKYADNHKIPVYHVQHVSPAGAAVFAIDGETVKFHKDMQPRPQDHVVQRTPSACSPALTWPHS